MSADLRWRLAHTGRDDESPYQELGALAAGFGLDEKGHCKQKGRKG